MCPLSSPTTSSTSSPKRETRTHQTLPSTWVAAISLCQRCESSSILCCRFKRLCEDAFMKLRDRGPLFINLFSMMLSCGIPELRTSDDINYIRDALCLGKTQDVALENFRKKLQVSPCSLASCWCLTNCV